VQGCREGHAEGEYFALSRAKRQLAAGQDVGIREVANQIWLAGRPDPSFNENRCHSSLDGATPVKSLERKVAALNDYN
jgi:hypothetical protein